VDIASNNAQAEVAPLRELASTLAQIKERGGSAALRAYLRNLRIPLYHKARVVVELTGGPNAGMLAPAPDNRLSGH